MHYMLPATRYLLLIPVFPYHLLFFEKKKDIRNFTPLLASGTPLLLAQKERHSLKSRSLAQVKHITSETSVILRVPESEPSRHIHSINHRHHSSIISLILGPSVSVSFPFSSQKLGEKILKNFPSTPYGLLLGVISICLSWPPCSKAAFKIRITL